MAIKSLAEYVQQQHVCATNLMSSLSSITSTMTTQLEKISTSLGKYIIYIILAW